MSYKKTFLKVFTKFTQESTCNASGSSSKVFSSMLAVAYDSYEWVLTKCNFCDLIANVYSVLCQTSSEAVTRRCSVKKMFLKILQNSQEAGLRHATLLKKSVWCSCFLVNFAKFLRTPFFLYITPPLAASAYMMEFFAKIAVKNRCLFLQ